MTIQIVYDVTHTFIGSVPQGGMVALYSTGTPDIKATQADIESHPGCLLICQDFGLTDTTADYADVESGAGTPQQVPQWFKAAVANYHNGVRPGQRWPAVYCSANNVTNVANALVNAGITSNGPGLVIANWSLTETQAIADVLAASGPFPIVGIQFRNNGPYDTDVMSGEWINTMSGPTTPVTPVKPTDPTPPTAPTPEPASIRIQENWHWCHKCQGLFHDELPNVSVCPAGGNHDGSESYDYVLLAIV